MPTDGFAIRRLRCNGTDSDEAGKGHGGGRGGIGLGPAAAPARVGPGLLSAVPFSRRSLRVGIQAIGGELAGQGGYVGYAPDEYGE